MVYPRSFPDSFNLILFCNPPSVLKCLSKLSVLQAEGREEGLIVVEIKQLAMLYCAELGIRNFATTSFTLSARP